MVKIRIKNDIQIQWLLFADELPYDLTDREISLYLCGPMGRMKLDDYTIEGNQITWIYRGKAQMYIGKYSLILIENEGKDDMHAVDACDAFCLVAHSCETGGENTGDVKAYSLNLTSQMYVGGSAGTGGGGPVDDVLDSESTNAIQNQAVAREFEKVYETMSIERENIIGLSVLHDMNYDFNEDYAI